MINGVKLAGIQRRNYVVLTLMRRDGVASASTRRNFDVMTLEIRSEKRSNPLVSGSKCYKFM